MQFHPTVSMLSSPALLLPRYGTLGHLPAGQHKPGEKRQIWDWDTGKYLGEIDEVPYTYNATRRHRDHACGQGQMYCKLQLQTVLKLVRMFRLRFVSR